MKYVYYVRSPTRIELLFGKDIPERLPTATEEIWEQEDQRFLEFVRQYTSKLDKFPTPIQAEYEPETEW